MQFFNDVKLDFDDVLIVPKSSFLDSRKKVKVERTFQLFHAGWEWTGVPIIAANMDTTGTIEMANALSQYKMLTALHKHHYYGDIDDTLYKLDNFVFYSMGITDNDLDGLKSIINLKREIAPDISYPRMICIDVANGYTIQFLDAIKRVRDMCPNAMIMAGNVVTPEKTEQVIISGADCVKVGIGPGSVCTTRIKTGIGFPQLSAIIECADAAHGIDGLVCGDGGCTSPGDVVKAFGGGADFVMVGGMLAGTDESAGEKVHINNSGNKLPISNESPATHVAFYGMSSKKANVKYHGVLANYKTAEGKESLIPYKGSVHEVVQDILGGLRSAMTYVGAKKLKELTKRTKFIRVNNQHNKIFD